MGGKKKIAAAATPVDDGSQVLGQIGDSDAPQKVAAQPDQGAMAAATSAPASADPQIQAIDHELAEIGNPRAALEELNQKLIDLRANKKKNDKAEDLAILRLAQEVKQATRVCSRRLGRRHELEKQRAKLAAA